MRARASGGPRRLAADRHPEDWSAIFFHTRHLRYRRKPERPKPIFAKRLRRCWGQWGEMSVMMNHPFPAWNCRAPARYRDMLMDIGTEEIAHVGMLATMIARLLETAPAENQEAAAKGAASLGAAPTRRARSSRP